jgi:serine protease
MTHRSIPSGRALRHMALILSLLTAVTVLAANPALARPAPAKVIHVPGDYSTIQAALDASKIGGTVLVDPGTYKENLDFHGRDIRLESTGGAAVTTLDVPGGTGVTIGPYGVFEGFTVTGALGDFGGGMAVSGYGTLIAQNIFEADTAEVGGYGAAIGGNNASPTIDRNFFRDNVCDDQYLSGVLSFINESSPHITNNVFKRNPCRAITMILPSGAAPKVENNTIVGNPVGIDISPIDITVMLFENNVIVRNGVGVTGNFGGPKTSPVWNHNLVWGNGQNYEYIADQTGKVGNISVSPKFVGGRFHLQADSPAIDTGVTIKGLRFDFDGNPRRVDGNGDGISKTDMGAFEFQPPTSLRR